MLPGSYCFDGLRFRTCDAQNPAMYFGIGLELKGGEAVRTFYRWHNPSKCLGRAGSDTKLMGCNEGGAKSWGLKDGAPLQNGGKWCVVRDLENMGHVVKCSTDNFEYVQVTIPQMAQPESAVVDPRRANKGRY